MHAGVEGIQREILGYGSHNVLQLMDLVLGGTPQKLAPHLSQGLDLSLRTCNVLSFGFLKSKSLNLLTRLWPQCWFCLL